MVAPNTRPLFEFPRIRPHSPDTEVSSLLSTQKKAPPKRGAVSFRTLRGNLRFCRRRFVHASVMFWFFSGNDRMRLPVAAKIALSTAGAATKIVGSPTPPQNPPDGMIMHSTFGSWFARLPATRIRVVASTSRSAASGARRPGPSWRFSSNQPRRAVRTDSIGVSIFQCFKRAKIGINYKL